MFHNLFRLVLIVVACTTVLHPVYGQQKRSANRLVFSLRPEFAFRKANIVSDNIGPQPISTTNTAVFAIGAGYERRTSYGLLYGFDVHYSREKYDINLNYDFLNFDAEADKPQLENAGFKRVYATVLPTITPRIMVGYEYRLRANKSGLSLQAKAGISIKYFKDGISSPTINWRITYTANDSAEIRTPVFTSVTYNIGKDRNLSSAKWRGIGCMDFYLGLVKQMPFKYLQSISAGVEFTTSTTNSQLSSNIYYEARSYDKDGGSTGTDYYLGRNRSLGLRIGLNFWK